MLEFLKWWIAGKELRALDRYRTACLEARRWLATEQYAAAKTAHWICDVGEGIVPLDASGFREHLRRKAQPGPGPYSNLNSSQLVSGAESLFGQLDTSDCELVPFEDLPEDRRVL